MPIHTHIDTHTDAPGLVHTLGTKIPRTYLRMIECQENVIAC